MCGPLPSQGGKLGGDYSPRVTKLSVDPGGAWRSPPHVWSPPFPRWEAGRGLLTQGHKVSSQQGRADGPALSRPVPAVQSMPSPGADLLVHLAA